MIFDKSPKVSPSTFAAFRVAEKVKMTDLMMDFKSKVNSIATSNEAPKLIF